MRSQIVASVIVSLTILAVGCSSERNSPGTRALAEKAAVGFDAQALPVGSRAGKDQPPTEPMEHRLVRTASLEVEVAAVEASLRELRRLSRFHGGMLSDGETTRERLGRLCATASIRVPSGRFEDALNAFKGLGKVEHERTETHDVTKAYFDLETRLKVKRSTEERLRELLRTSTGEVAQVLEVERELDRVVTQIEEMEGERSYYDHQIVWSTISVRLTEPRTAFAGAASWKLADALQSSVAALATSIAVLSYLLAFLLPWAALGAAGWLLVALVRKRLHRSAKAA
jgi:hypothetical protein